MFRTLLVNTGSNMVVMFVKLIITFIMTPIFVINLGRYDLGLWEMVGAAVGYMGFLSLGIQPAISRFAANYKALNDTENLRLTYSSTFYFMVVIGVLLLTLLTIIGWNFSELLSVDAEENVKYSIFLTIIGCQLFFCFPGYVAESYLEGFQKYYLKNNITIINSLIGSSVLYFFITPDNSLLLLAAVNAIGFIVKYIIYIIILGTQPFGRIYPASKYFSFKVLKETVAFGFKSFIQGVSTRIENGTDTLVIGYFLSPVMVPFYSIPANLINHIRMIGWTTTHASMPFFSELNAKQESHLITQIYLNASKYVISFLMPLCVGVLLVGSSFISLWISPEFGVQAESILIWLVLFVSLPFIDPFNSRYLTAIGKHGILAKFMPISAVINIILTIILVPYMGIEGAALASAIPVLFFVPFFLNYVCINLGISIFKYITYSVLPAALPSALMVLGIIVFKSYYPIVSYASLLAVVGVGALIYIVSFYVLALRADERQFLTTKIRSILK